MAAYSASPAFFATVPPVHDRTVTPATRMTAPATATASRFTAAPRPRRPSWRAGGRGTTARPGWASTPAAAEYRRTCGANPAVFADPADGDADAADGGADEVGAGARCGPAGPAGAQPATSTAATGARARRYRSLRPERRRLFDIRERYALAGRAPPPAGSRPEIVTSWARSPGGPAARRRILDARPPCRGC